MFKFVTVGLDGVVLGLRGPNTVNTVKGDVIDSLSCCIMKSFIDFSGSSAGGSGIPEKIRLSLILRAAEQFPSLVCSPQ